MLLSNTRNEFLRVDGSGLRGHSGRLSIWQIFARGVEFIKSRSYDVFDVHEIGLVGHRSTWKMLAPLGFIELKSELK